MRSSNWQQHCKQTGFSIVEAMIAITLGLILLGGVLHIFSSNKQTFHTQSGLARLQENGRYAKFILSKDIRMAGYQGCPKLARIEPNNLVASFPANATFTLADVLQGHDGSGTSFSPALPTWLTAGLASGTQVLPGTDVIVIRKATPTGASLSANMTSAGADLSITNKITVNPGDLLLISDCEAADLFKASSGTSGTTITHKSTDNTSSNLSKAYQTDARVYHLQTFAYYIKDTGRKNQLNQPVYALFRQDINGNEEELIDGVENMQMTYGVDTNNDGTADTYQTASQVEAANDWDKVISLDIALLLSTVENVNPQAQSYTYLGTKSTPTDKLLRRQWDSFIMLRNRNA